MRGCFLTSWLKMLYRLDVIRHKRLNHLVSLDALKLLIKPGLNIGALISYTLSV